MAYRAYDAFNRGDWDGVLALVDEGDVVRKAPKSRSTSDADRRDQRNQNRR
jgi:hypothetical protein